MVAGYRLRGNILPTNALSGDELYGIEPVLVLRQEPLNLNLVAPLDYWRCRFNCCRVNTQRALERQRCRIFVWMAITVPRPHKEERFLFPFIPFLSGRRPDGRFVLNAIGRMEAAVSRHKELAVRHVSD
jgi:alpha-1,2-mannosyltransferase